ncbi:O-antigen ligase family protein [Terribacillus saccharophilus]|uniref:O-antigen ligase family protein n=1 Tax=Terribacillus saccharophilus TaxID=361277 RepID=UPI00298A022A|nr:O-antigen ligase family protein [Terribacillus saccharophilus]MCM3225247.1 O-antigen ligase family protein [Terribacillus saccharophilus]
MGYIGGIGAASGYFGTPHLVLLIGIISFCFFSIKHKSIKSITFNKIDIAVLVFLIFIFLSSFTAPYKEASNTQLNFYVTLTINMFLWRMAFKNINKKEKILIYGLIVSLLLQFSISILQIITNSSIGLSFLGEGTVARRQGVPIPSITGTIGHPGPLSLYTLFILNILFPYILMKRNHIVTFGFTIGLIMLILTFSRTSLILLFISLFIQILFIYRSKFKNISKFKVVLLIIGSGLVIIFFGNLVIDRFVNLFNADTDNQFNNRFTHLLIAIEYIKEHPYVGYGLNNWSYIVSINDPRVAEIVGYRNEFFFNNPVHNIYALYFFEGGIFLLISFIVLIFLLLKNLYKLINDKLIVLGLFGCIFSMTLYNFTGWGLLNGGQVISLLFLVTSFTSSILDQINTKVGETFES